MSKWAANIAGVVLSLSISYYLLVSAYYPFFRLMLLFGYPVVKGLPPSYQI